MKYLKRKSMAKTMSGNPLIPCLMGFSSGDSLRMKKFSSSRSKTFQLLRSYISSRTYNDIHEKVHVVWGFPFRSCIK